MVKSLSCSHLNSIFKVIGTFCLLLLFFGSVCGQAISLVKKVPLKNLVVTGSIDRGGNIYIADKKGSLYKMDSAGVLLHAYSPDRKGKINYLEAWETLNVLLFYGDLQEYRYLNRFLTQLATQRLPQNIFASLLTPSADNSIWVFDDSDFTLKKLNTGYNAIEIVTDLSGIVDVNFQGAHIREYQHLIFMADSQAGIYVFDNLGNYIRTLTFSNVHYFSFLQNKLYFLSGNNVLFYDIYTGEEWTIPIPLEQEYKLVLATDTRLYLVAERSIDIYQYAVD